MREGAVWGRACRLEATPSVLCLHRVYPSDLTYYSPTNAHEHHPLRSIYIYAHRRDHRRIRVAASQRTASGQSKDEHRRHHVARQWRHVLFAPAARDSRPRLPQCLRHPHAGLCDEAPDVKSKLPASASHHESCAHHLRLAHVACAWPTFTADISAIILWRQSREYGILNSTATEHSKLSRQPDRQKELCARHQHSRPQLASSVPREHTETKQCLQCATECRNGRRNPAVVFHNGTSAGRHTHRPATIARSKHPRADGTGADGILDTP